MAKPGPSLPGKPSSKKDLSFFLEDGQFIKRVIAVIFLFALSYIVWRISSVLLLLFAALLIALLLRSGADLLDRHLGMRGWGLTVTTVFVILCGGGFVFLFGSQIAGQLSELVDKIPATIDAAGERFGMHRLSEEIREAVTGGADRSNMLSIAAIIGYTTLGAIFDFLLVFIAAVYLAADPKLYRRGIAKLFPPHQHERIFEAMDATSRALRLWFSGQLFTMLIVGLASAIAYWWIGLPSPLALAFIAAITNFIPYLGPIAGAVPALVFALAIDVDTALWTLAAVVLIQQVEGNFLTPYIQRRAVLMPAVTVLFSVVVFGVIFGTRGLILGVPLAVAITVLVKKLWVRETLGESTELPGEKNHPSPVK